MINLCANIGFDIDSIQFIPYSGYTGQNLVNKYEDEDIYKKNKMEWYKGKTLLESLDELKPPKRAFHEPLKISIFNTKNVSGVGTVFEGKILSGTLKKNMELYVPMKDEMIKGECKSIEIFNHQINEAIAGDIIGFIVGDIGFFGSRECKLVFSENAMDSIINADNLRVKILMIDKKVTLKIGSVLNLFCYTLNMPTKIAKIEYIVDRANKILEKEPKEIKNGDYAIAIIKLIKKDKYCWENFKITKIYRLYTFFEKYINNPFLGSFELFNDELIAVGKIKDINVL